MIPAYVHVAMKPATDLLRAMIVDTDAKRRSLLAHALAEVGCNIVASASMNDNLLPLIEQHDPDIIIMDMDMPSRDTLENLARVQNQVPRPIVMFAQDDDSATIRRAVQAGVSAYVVDGLQTRRVRPIIEAAIARFEQYRGLEAELARTREQLAERKTIEKAKGLIMRQRGLSENEAYQALRKTAMRTNSRIADVAERLIISAELLF